MRLLLLFFLAAAPAFGAKVVCYWNGKSFWREGTAKVTTKEIKEATGLCTHLIYGFAAINDDSYQLEPIYKNVGLDTENVQGQWKNVTALKKAHPGMPILLSVGGYEDTEDMDKYVKVLEKAERRTSFINSVVSLLKEDGFDGIDLAWQFPHQEEKDEKSLIGSIWDSITKAFGIGVDKKAGLHNGLFVALCSELKAELRPENKTLSIAILPHINSTTYFDVSSLMPYVDMVNLWTVDFRTPDRSPDKADFAHPLNFVQPRLPHQNADAVVRHWMENGAEFDKLNLGIATWGRSWTFSRGSTLSGVPPLTGDGPGEKGPHTKKVGFLAYYEICVKLVSPRNYSVPEGSLRKVSGADSTIGACAYTLPSKKLDGQWVSYEEPRTAELKALYAKAMGLGGVAILDLALDDPQAVCNENSFPITRAAKARLESINQASPANIIRRMTYVNEL